jgi:hypothetical protein
MMGLFLEKSTYDEKNITLPLRCTMEPSTAEVCYWDNLIAKKPNITAISEKKQKLHTNQEHGKLSYASPESSQELYGTYTGANGLWEKKCTTFSWELILQQSSNLTSCRSLHWYQCFRGTYCLHLQGCNWSQYVPLKWW